MDYRSLAPPHGFSQLATSFVASESLGILRTPLMASAFAFASFARRYTNIATPLSSLLACQ